MAEGKKITARTQAAKNPVAVFNAFLDRLRAVRVLEPACGSGNFLYLALQALKDLEREAILWGSLTLSMPMQFPQVGPQALLGIELNTYAAELASVVIWIGEIQWMLSNGFACLRDPVLRPLNNIECRDAVLDLSELTDPRKADWPEATVIVGKQPFLGGKLLRANLGDGYVDALFRVYQDRVPHEADLVAYWHEKARAMVEAGKVKRVGLLATQGIRGGANRRVLERIKETGDIFLAWADEPWVVEGAVVNVSFVGYDDGSEEVRQLDGQLAAAINANLTAGIDLTSVRRLKANLGIAFMGDTKGGPFDISAKEAEAMLASPNPDGRSNSEVVRPWVNGLDLAGRPRDMWIIDFGINMPIEEAALYEAPFEYVMRHVKPQRKASRTTIAEWWLHERRRGEMRQALLGLDRFIATPRVTRHRLFVWLPKKTLPDSAVIVFARDDDYFFGLLHSSVHELLARGLGTQVREVESGFRYTPTTTFETFPLPDASDDAKEEIAEVAKTLDTLRSGWLNPPGLLGAELRARTLTNLYNLHPSWLAQVHERLDRAVHAAYGWDYPLEREDVLARLVKLNTGRAVAQELTLGLGLLEDHSKG